MRIGAETITWWGGQYGWRWRWNGEVPVSYKLWLKREFCDEHCEYVCVCVYMRRELIGGTLYFRERMCVCVYMFIYVYTELTKQETMKYWTRKWRQGLSFSRDGCYIKTIVKIVGQLGWNEEWLRMRYEKYEIHRKFIQTRVKYCSLYIFLSSQPITFPYYKLKPNTLKSLIIRALLIETRFAIYWKFS